MLEVRPAHEDEVETLLAIQREAAVDAFAHVYPPERYPFPDDEIRAGWAAALADPKVEVYVAECDGAPAGSVSVGEEHAVRPTGAPGPGCRLGAARLRARAAPRTRHP